MRVTCPSCNAELSLDVLLAHEGARAAMARLVEQGVPLGGPLMRYVALFRPPKRRLSIERMVSLLLELLPDIERQAVARKGRDWAADAQTWRAAIDHVLAMRDKGSLALPLTSHGYLYEVIVGMADKAEARVEREVETERRSKRTTAGALTPHDAQAVADFREALKTPDGPSRYAQRLQAEIAARKVKEQGDGHQE